MARARELPRYRDWSPVVVSWWLLWAGVALVVLAVGYLLGSKWWLAAAAASAAAAAAVLVAVRAIRLGRSEAMVVRTELLDAIRALPPADAWADMDHGLAYQLQVRPSGFPGIAPGVYVEEIDLDDGVITTPGGGQRMTARQYGILPWQPRVRVEIVEGSGPGGPDDGQRSSRRSGPAWIWHSWRARHARLLYAQEAEVRQLAARLAGVEPAD